MAKKKKYTFIDLFAGCGGLSEGFLESGQYEALAHIEWEKPMVDSHPLKSPFLRDIVLEQYLAKMDFLRDDYIENETGEHTFNYKDVERGNQPMDECCNVCKANGVDVYDLMSEYLFAY